MLVNTTDIHQCHCFPCEGSTDAVSTARKGDVHMLILWSIVMVGRENYDLSRDKESRSLLLKSSGKLQNKHP